MPLLIGAEVAALRRLNAKELRQRFAELFGQPTHTANKTWLVRRIAWRRQVLKRPQATAVPASRVALRCAIYTRKSTEEGLDQDFNSLDAQRESAEAFVKSQAAEGWTCLPERYDDGGYTGGNMDRPALKR